MLTLLFETDLGWNNLMGLSRFQLLGRRGWEMELQSVNSSVFWYVYFGFT